MFHTALAFISLILILYCCWLTGMTSILRPLDSLALEVLQGRENQREKDGKRVANDGKCLLLYWNFPMPTIKSQFLRSYCRPWGNHVRNSPGTGRSQRSDETLASRVSLGLRLKPWRGAMGRWNLSIPWHAIALFKAAMCKYHCNIFGKGSSTASRRFCKTMSPVLFPSCSHLWSKQSKKIASLAPPSSPSEPWLEPIEKKQQVIDPP